MKKLHTKERGITIITLVITIIILLILAGISIASLIGNDGLINKAKKAAKDYENAQEDELAMLNELSNYIGSGKINNGDNSNNQETTIDNLLDKIKNEVKDEMKDEINNLKNQVLEEMYPVGSVYISTDLSTTEAVAQKLGGTWESYGQGRTLVGVGTGNDGVNNKEFAINTTGGEYNHTLSIDEMPKHNHGFSAFVYLPGSGNVMTTGNLSATGDTATANTGGSQAHNNIQPYIAVYMWKRVS